jgi:hypothetical protein
MQWQSWEVQPVPYSKTTDLFIARIFKHTSTPHIWKNSNEPKMWLVLTHYLWRFLKCWCLSITLHSITHPKRLWAESSPLCKTSDFIQFNSSTVCIQHHSLFPKNIALNTQTHLQDAGFELPMVVTVKNTVFFDVTLCSPVEVYRCLGKYVASSFGVKE